MLGQLDPLPGTTRRQFEETLDRIGIWAVYARADHRFPCTRCELPSPGEGRPDCPVCLGTGYQTTLERWLCGYASHTRRVQAIEGEVTLIGLDPPAKPVIFNRAADVPRTGDRIFLVEWNVPRERQGRQGQPATLVQPLLVTYPDPQILAGVAFWVTTVEVLNETRQQYEGALLQRPVPPRPLTPRP